MTPESRVGVLHGLLERVWRNAREPRPAFLEFWDRPSTDRPPRARPARTVEPPAAELLVPMDGPPPTAPGRDREALLTFGDESTQTGDPLEAERLILLEQEEALRAQEARPSPTSAPPTPRSPALSTFVAPPEPRLPRLAPPPARVTPPMVTLTASTAPTATIDEDDEVSLVIDDFDLAGPATQPPGAASSMPDIEAIENDALDLPDAFRGADPRATLTNEAALERARAESIRPSDRLPVVDDHDIDSVPPPPKPPPPPPPPPPVSTVVSTPDLRSSRVALGDDDDDVPSSVRKPVQLDRPIDDAFDGFGPVSPPSEPPPESGEVPSQRRLLTPPAMGAASEEDSGAIDVRLDSAPPQPAFAVAPTAGFESDRETASARDITEATRLGAGLPRIGAEEDDDDLGGETRLFRQNERPFADEPSGVSERAPAPTPRPDPDDADVEDDEAAARFEDEDDEEHEEDELDDEEHDRLEDGEYEATKEIRTMGRVDVIERQALAPAEVIVLSEPRQKSPATFGELLDLALSIGS